MTDDLTFAIVGVLLFTEPAMHEDYLRAIDAGMVMLGVSMVVFCGSSTKQEAKAIQTAVQDVIPTEVVEAPGWRTK